MFGSILSVAGPLLGGLMQSGAASDAASQQAQGTQAAIAEQQRQFDLNRSDLAPWRTAGGAAIGKLSDLLGLTTLNPDQSYVAGASPTASYQDLLDAYNKQHVADHGVTLEQSVANGTTSQAAYNQIIGRLQGQVAQNANPQTASNVPGYGDLTKTFTAQDFQNDPVNQLSFNYGMDQGTKAIGNMARASGTGDTGGTLKALTRFGQDYAGSKAADSYNRFVNDQTNLYNRLSGVAGTGQTAASTTAQLGSSTASNIGNLVTSGANARGAAGIAGANAIGSGFAGASNNYQQTQLLKQLLGNAGATGTTGGGFSSGGTYGLDY